MLSTTQKMELRSKLGTHIIAEAYFENSEILNDQKKIEEALIDASIKGNMTVINVSSHTFSPHGVTALVLLAESHISIHTWPEFKYAAIDIFACGKGEPVKSLERLKEIFPIKELKVIKIDRGLF